MFENRIKYFLLFLIGACGLLALRAAFLQIAQGGQYVDRAARLMRRTGTIETTRGKILDNRGRTLAADEACVDACVDYRVIQREPDAPWVKNFARARLISRMGGAYRAQPLAQQKELLAMEIKAVQADIQNLWPTLASLQVLPNDPPERFRQRLDEIQDIRQSIELRVEMQQRWLWYQNYKNAIREHSQQQDEDSIASLRRFLLGDDADMPKIDSFDIEVGEQSSVHTVLRAIDSGTEQLLGKNLEALPGLSLRPGAHRVYPFNDVGCHFIGNLSAATREDIRQDLDAHVDELKIVRANDQIGRSGVEKLCDSVLRGSRGKIITASDGHELVSIPAQAGQDVVCSVDIELQRDIQELFKSAPITDGKGAVRNHRLMHGAAVVIDVPTGEVRALVSYPTYDLNLVYKQYAVMQEDVLNLPLLNRATQAVREPGSTVKPVVGLGAMAMNVLRADERIECTGFLVINGERQKRGRCWVASMWLNELRESGVAHHQLPPGAESPTGFLDYPEALERSCNVFFENMADRMGLEGVAYWYDKFGLGRRTGIGIAESAGYTPSSYRGDLRRMTTWFAGIGQGRVGVTPLQMANVAATIARGGVWVQPTLVRSPAPFVQQRVDLKLSRQSLDLCRQGMIRVVQSRAGSGYATRLRRDDIVVAAKSGSAQTFPLRIPKLGVDGKALKDESGKTIYDTITPGTIDEPNPLAPWYMGFGKKENELTHSWFIGFAPADKPQVAFAVLVEYGGSGGSVAGPVAGEMLEACVEHGYLSRNK